MEIKVRLGNLELRKAVCIGNKEPEYPSYHIDKWGPNPHYKQERKYIKDGDYYRPKDSHNCRIHKNCFKNPETCYSIASFDRDKEGFYEINFIGARPFDLNKEEREIFWKLMSIGNIILNNINDVEI
jgi:hypothetical protein